MKNEKWKMKNVKWRLRTAALRPICILHFSFLNLHSLRRHSLNQFFNRLAQRRHSRRGELRRADADLVQGRAEQVGGRERAVGGEFGLGIAFADCLADLQAAAGDE